MESSLPTQPLPFVWCDFNACGWAGNGDNSYYALHRETLAAIAPHDGMRVFLYDIDEPGTIFGCIAELRFVTLGAFSEWRAEPVAGTRYVGPNLPADAELTGCAFTTRPRPESTMRYRSDGIPITIGDHVAVENGIAGRVVCDFETWLCLDGYERFLTREPLADGSTLSSGVLVETAGLGFVHYASNDASIARRS
jgi:hypothetical protein